MQALLKALWLGVFIGLVWGVQKPWAIAIGILPAIIWIQIILWRKHLHFIGERPKQKKPRNRQRALSKASQSVTGGILPATLPNTGVFARFRSQLAGEPQKGLLTGQQPSTKRFRFSSFSVPKPTSNAPDNLPVTTLANTPVTTPVTTPNNTIANTPVNTATPVALVYPTVTRRTANEPIKKAIATTHTAVIKKTANENIKPSELSAKAPSVDKKLAPELRKTRRQLNSLGKMDENQDLLGIFDDIRHTKKKKTPLLTAPTSNSAKSDKLVKQKVGNKSLGTGSSSANLSANLQVKQPNEKNPIAKMTQSSQAITASTLKVSPAKPKKITAKTPSANFKIQLPKKEIPQPSIPNPPLKNPISLDLAWEALNSDNWNKARAQLDKHMSNSHLPHPNSLKLQTTLAIHVVNHKATVQYLADWLAIQQNFALTDLQSLWNYLPESASPKLIQLIKKQTLQTLIKHAQTNNQQQILLASYALQTSLLTKWGEQEELVQSLRQQLQLHEQLGNIPKQLELIDKLGHHYYNMNQKDEAQACYKAGLKLKEKLA